MNAERDAARTPLPHVYEHVSTAVPYDLASHTTPQCTRIADYSFVFVLNGVSS
jgi:hypothetical protein